MDTGRPSSARDRPRPLLVVGAWCASAALLLGFAVLVGWLARTGWADGVDRDWLGHVAHLRGPGPSAALRWVTLLGDPRVLLTTTGAVAAVLVRRRRIEAALLLATSATGALALTVVAKWLVARDRPDHGALVAAQSFALPSTHSALVIACLGAMAIALGGMRRPRSRWAARWSVVAGAAAAVGFSRVYLGVHWPSDVLLGWVVGALWLATCAAATRALAPLHRIAPVPVRHHPNHATRPDRPATDGAQGCAGRPAPDPPPAAPVDRERGQVAERRT